MAPPPRSTSSTLPQNMVTFLTQQQLTPITFPGVAYGFNAQCISTSFQTLLQLCATHLKRLRCVLALRSAPVYQHHQTIGEHRSSTFEPTSAGMSGFVRAAQMYFCQKRIYTAPTSQPHQTMVDP